MMVHFKSSQSSDVKLMFLLWCMASLAMAPVIFMVFSPHDPLTLSSLVRTDRQLMQLLNGDAGAMVDRFWYAYSSFRVWTLVMGMVAVSLWTVCGGTWRRRLVFLVVVVLLLAFLDQLSSGVIKPLVGRLRPSHDPAICGLLHYVGDYRGGRYGFVSGHATNIVGLVTWLCLVYKDKLSRSMFLLFAVMMCYSRIYLGVHYPGDILAGAILGASISTVVYHFVAPHFEIDHTRRPVGLMVAIGATVIVLIGYGAWPMI
ncbi:MAG: phosphatase PAP2 family protein [Prevotella sp.]